jgi:hypothetical protein
VRWFSVLQSVLAALFGVQSEQKRQHDFQTPKPLPYILVGIVLVALFILSLVLIVNTILATPN